MDIPRPEHPRPHWRRERWLNLNGWWGFERDPGDSGRERGLLDRALADRILVPFCPEAALSGIGLDDRCLAVWYRRTVVVPEAWAGQEVLLHLQAVDHDATIWVNGIEVGRHRGGFTPITCPLAGIARPGQALTIVVRARDDWRGAQARGKQSQAFASAGCHYSRTSGIWQTVWLEAVPRSYCQRARVIPDLPGGRVLLHVPVAEARTGQRVRAQLRDANGIVAQAEAAADGGAGAWLELRIPASRLRPWSPRDPALYALGVSLCERDGSLIDRVTSEVGVRSIAIEGRTVLLNGEPIFQRLVLDQGYYPDGLMTAPTDQALIDDIRLAQEAGFTGARLHQKVFEERFLAHADRMGYLCWGEYGDWGAQGPADQRLPASLIGEWIEAVVRDQGHPSLIGWCPLNEQIEPWEDRIDGLDVVAHALVAATTGIDGTRPVLDCSGYSHRVASCPIYDSHDYDQNPGSFRERHAAMAKGKAPWINAGERGQTWSIPYRGQAYFVSEFGGMRWNPDAVPGSDSWGYGDAPATEEAFYERFAALTAALLDQPDHCGYCYTQLTDVFQEQNGIVGFDRRRKLDLDRLRAAQQRPGACERRGRERATPTVDG